MSGAIMHGNWVNTAWFAALGALLIGYAIFDGMDLGVGAMHLILGRSDAERRTHFEVIGPFWFSYEVWLLVAGGSMVAAFPRLYATSFSGFYLVLSLVLWLLIGRGTSIEFRSRVADPLWRGFWDVAFCGCSALLAVLFGAAIGNVVRGVPLDAAGNFQGSLTQALNPYALLVGVLSLILLALHGTNLIAYRTDGALRDYARLWASRLWPAVALLSLAASGFAPLARPGAVDNFLHLPLLFLIPLAAAAALIWMRLCLARYDDRGAIFAGAAFLAALMGSAGASLYPSLLPALGQAEGGLTIFNAAAPRHNLLTALATFVISMALVAVYSILIHRVFRGTVEAGPDEHGY